MSSPFGGQNGEFSADPGKTPHFYLYNWEFLWYHATARVCAAPALRSVDFHRSRGAVLRVYMKKGGNFHAAQRTEDRDHRRQPHPRGDTGSPEVQVAILTERINVLTEHMREQPPGQALQPRPAEDGRQAPPSAGLPPEEGHRALSCPHRQAGHPEVSQWRRVVRLCRTTLFPHSFNARGQADLLAVEGGTGDPAVVSSAKWFGSRGDHTKKGDQTCQPLSPRDNSPTTTSTRWSWRPPPDHGGGQAGGAGQRRRHGGLRRHLVLCCVTAAPRPQDGIDFFPLSVDFEEKLYSVGRIPGSFNRREGCPGEKGILTSRVIDRPIRPLFPPTSAMTCPSCARS